MDIRKNTYSVIATICVGLGLVGAVVPLLPTTPFLLLAIFLYMRSSRRGVKMILRNRFLSPYVKSYFSKEGIPAHILIRTLTLLWITMGCCIVWATGNLHIRIFLFLIAVGVTIHLLAKRQNKS